MTHEELIDMCARLGKERDALQREVDDAIGVLALYGIPSQRARHIGNGISVLVMRMDKALLAEKAAHFRTAQNAAQEAEGYDKALAELCALKAKT